MYLCVYWESTYRNDAQRMYELYAVRVVYMTSASPSCESKIFKNTFFKQQIILQFAASKIVFKKKKFQYINVIKLQINKIVCINSFLFNSPSSDKIKKTTKSGSVQSVPSSDIWLANSKYIHNNVTDMSTLWIRFLVFVYQQTQMKRKTKLRSL